MIPVDIDRNAHAGSILRFEGLEEPLPPWVHDAAEAVFSPQVALWAATWLGVVMTYLYSFTKKAPSTIAFLKKVMPSTTTERAFILIDFLVNAVIGTIVGIILHAPQNSYQALAAGVTWSAGVSLLIREPQK